VSLDPSDPSRPTLLVATRSADKLREIRDILGDCGVGIVSLDECGVDVDPDEDAVEGFDSFAANAIAKARHFCARTGLATVADDSGIVVPALAGRPGVLSRRFAETRGITPPDGQRDATNLAFLLEEMSALEGADRRAYYACVAALAVPMAAGDAAAFAEPAVRVFSGTCEGLVADRPVGNGGFGYDPAFLVPSLGITFGEAPAAVKHRLSHRAHAFRALASCLPAALRTS
jgi:XTP/dITP diphosphohydrolase